jgi:hypothetical protein
LGRRETPYASEAKQEELAKNCAMRALVNIMNHFGYGGKFL